MPYMRYAQCHINAFPLCECVYMLICVFVLTLTTAKPCILIQGGVWSQPEDRCD